MKKLSILVSLVALSIFFSGCNIATKEDKNPPATKTEDKTPDTDVTPDTDTGDPSGRVTAGSFKITEPVTTLVDGEKTFELNGDRFEFTGIMNPEITKIEASYLNEKEGIREIYPVEIADGATDWGWIADSRYGNLGEGRNDYTFNGYVVNAEGESLIGSDSIVVNAKFEEVVADVPEGNSFEVDFLPSSEPVDFETWLKNMGKYEKAKELMGEIYFTDTLIYKLGTVKEGPYAGGTLFLMESPCDGMCIDDFHYRIIQKSDNSLVLLQKLSSVFFPDIDGGSLDIITDEESSISNLFPPKRVAIPGSEYQLKRIDSILFDLIGEIEKKDLFSSDETGQEFYISTIDECIVGENADGTISKYLIDFDFLKSADESLEFTAENFSAGYVAIIWDDGTATTDNYYVSSMYTGCGAQSCFHVVGSDNSMTYMGNEVTLGALIPAGTTATGVEVMVEEYTDEDIRTITDRISPETFGTGSRMLEAIYNGFYADPKPSFEEFAKSKPVFYVTDPFGRTLQFMKQDYLPAVECGKPVIYLYPEVTADVSVFVKPNGGFKFTEPEYGNGWKVEASPKSELLNLADGNAYPYLFWEGKGIYYAIPEQGWVVKKDEIPSFLREKLAEQGLIDKEIDDFMEFWAPKMEEKPYYFITFVPQNEFEKIAPLTVEPRPDTVIRVFMDFKGLDEKTEVEPMNLITPERKGFVVVEWGGALHE